MLEVKNFKNHILLGIGHIMT